MDIKEYIILVQQASHQFKTNKNIRSDADKQKGKLLKSNQNQQFEINDINIEPESFSSISGSASISASNSSGLSQSLRQKQLIDENEVPRSLQNLKKAIYIFFLILIGTSFSVLAVNQIQNQQFQKDSAIVTHAITIAGNFNYQRLAYRMMLSTVKIPEKEVRFNLQYLQQQIDQFFDRLKIDVNQVTDEDDIINQELRDMMELQKSQNKGDQFQYLVLIITMSCISITFLSAFGMVPVTSSLDNEAEYILVQWMHIERKTKLQCLNQIKVFLEIWNDEQNEQVQIKTKQPIIDERDLELLNETVSFNYHSAQQSLQSKLPPITQKKHTFQSRKQQLQEYNVDRESYIFSSYIVDSIIRSDANLNNKQNQESIVEEFEDQTSKISQKENKTNIKGINLNELNRKDSYQTAEYSTIQQQNQDLKSIFRLRKIKKIILIFGFSFVILGFYLTFYFISARIFESSKESFNFIFNFSRRPACLANSVNFMIETFVQNRTILVGFNQQKIQDFINQTCMSFEQVLQEYQQKPPTQLQSIHNQINLINSDQVCSIVFKNQPDVISQCLQFNNGEFNNGLSNVIMGIYYFIQKEFVSYYSFEGMQWLRTNQFLDQHEFQTKNQDSVIQLFKYVIPMSSYLESIVRDSLKDYQDNLMQIYLIIFAIFMVFLLISLIVSVRTIIQHLKTLVIRTKLLVKIIPSDALPGIAKQIKREQIRKDQKINKEIFDD
ncbi:UNKNOWN [Stylonychia lemnae]|uniref:Transmembrane protein n=1 Tax=Stylonychia lemnae TaxID=5949 RepID=A0A078BDZ1_STYLE|nr:UNKNOWN [Stylonychia lemnae]|eukprot:CDW91798.1 UNKNOWN [Stylonychia lemnae]